MMAQTFDASRLELSGGPIALPAAPPFAGNAGFYGFSASATGVLAYSAASNAGPQRLVWVDRAGAVVDRTDLVADGLSTVSENSAVPALADADFLIEFGPEFDIAKDFLIIAPVPFAVADHKAWLEPRKLRAEPTNSTWSNSRVVIVAGRID